LKRSWRLQFALIGLAVCSLLAAAPVPRVAAHPYEGLIQDIQLSLTPHNFTAYIQVVPGQLSVRQVWSQIDLDKDDVASPSEVQAWATWYMSHVTLEIDTQQTALAVADVSIPERDQLQTGADWIKLIVRKAFAQPLRGQHSLRFMNNNYKAQATPSARMAPDNQAQVINFTGASDFTQSLVFQLGPVATVAPASTQSAATGPVAPPQGHTPVSTASEQPPEAPLRGSSRDLRGSASAEEQGAESIPPAPVPPGSPAAIAPPPRSGSPIQQRLEDLMRAPDWGPGFIATALVIAAMLGALHALTPGHGKTIAAAYLVGSRGTLRHAAALGGVVTFTHTASVLVLGMITLAASQFVEPERLRPALEIISGIVIVALGVQLAWTRLRQLRHERDHDHDHSHHRHDMPEGQVRWRSLVALGMSGGLVPCPEALAILLLAVGLGQIVLGLALIVAFSFGLAAVLIAIGALLVTSHVWLRRFESASRLGPYVPVASALVVVVLGVGILARAVIASG
jgi:ABC-type nickel/cobalt efflux system permease component RcnA